MTESEGVREGERWIISEAVIDELRAADVAVHNSPSPGILPTVTVRSEVVINHNEVVKRTVLE